MFNYYLLEEGENLDTISNTFKIKKEKLMELNEITDESLVRAGSEIKVPVLNSNYFD